MSKQIYLFFLLLIWISSLQTILAQSPTDPAKGFQVFVEKGASLSSSQSEGPIAIGENLTINGNYQVANKYAGTFAVNNILIGLLVNGKIIYQAGNALQVNNGYVKIGSLENSKVWFTDNNGSYSNVEICNGSYNSSPRIQLPSNSEDLNISDSKNSVESGNLLDFGSAMEAMRKSSQAIGAKINNVKLTDGNGNPVLANKYPSQVRINLNTGINYLYISGNDLNSISVFTYNNKPDANHVLVVNVDAANVFNWQVWNQAGVSISECPYILYNFYNTTTLKIEGSNAIEGTLFAPNADIYKKINSSNIEGQVIGISYEQDAGENHYANFDADAEGVGCSKPIVSPITGNTVVCLGLTTALNSITPGGIWSSSASNYGKVSSNGLVTGVAVGSFVISYTLTNECGTTIVTSAMSTKDCGIVSSGNNGGLESKSLGDAVATRLYKAATNSELVMKPYQQLPELKQSKIIQKSAGLGAQLNLLDLIPKQLTNVYIKPYITTPSDIVSLTNAKAVASSDYTLNGSCKAVVFATLTQSVIYDHSKTVCDRLKGAIIQNIEKIKLLGFDMLRFDMMYEDGHQESVICFSAGTKAGRNSFSIQSNWLYSDYIAEDNMYNFQVWGVSNVISWEITEKILQQLSTIAPLDQPYQVKALPKTYFMGVNRDDGSINLDLHNSDQTVSGYFEIFEKSNEKSLVLNKKNIPFTINAGGDTKIHLPVSDIYESTINMYINDSLVDEVFIADGAWNVDYNAANTVLNKFEIVNDSKPIVPDEYPVYRNVHLEGTTATYISAYKLLRGGGMPKDLTGYKTLKFTASGNSTLGITLVKSSINKWEDQYSIYIPISNDTKEYMVDLNDFVSVATKDKINPNDINSIVFSMGPLNGTMASINTSLSKISFTKESINYIESLKSKAINIFPNPTKGKFSCVFKSEKVMIANLMVTDASSGINILNKSISINKGDNTISVDISGAFQNPTGGACVISIKNAETMYKSQKLIIVPN